MIGLIPEPPFDPHSWSGSSARFFRAMQTAGLKDAYEVALSPLSEGIAKARNLAYPLSAWKERYHASVPRFQALSAAAGKIIARESPDAVLQIGAWFSSGAVTNAPCYSYHDGNAALRYRYVAPLSRARIGKHLEWERQVYQKLTGIFVMSEWLARSFVEDFSVPRDKVHVVGAGINLEEWPAETERDFHTPHFLFVGQDFERKGGRYLLEAFREVKKAVPATALTIIGPPQTCAAEGVTFAGFLSKAHPREYATLKTCFEAATTLVLPSIYEPFGISLLEGMAYGLPCIAADRCAMPEIVQHGKTGFVVPAEDAKSLAGAMIDLARDAGLSRKFGQAGRKRVQDEFTWTAVAGKIRGVARW